MHREVIMILTGSVGENGTNSSKDVQYVQRLLNDWGGRLGKPLISVDGIIGQETNTAIREFQTEVTGIIDGRIDPGGIAIQSLQRLHIGAIFDDLDPEMETAFTEMNALILQIEAGTSEEAMQLRVETEAIPSALEFAVKDYLQELYNS
jgi:peptidoglycan hydrolase-like protein with peptidoglycan-binding domain